MNRTQVQKKFRPGVGTILIIVNLTILILPVASLLFFRTYENLLIQETEGELIAQSAVLDARFRQAIRRNITDYKSYGLPVERPAPNDENGRYTPVKPQINLASNLVLPPRPDPLPPVALIDAPLLDIGQSITELFNDAQRVTLAGMRLLDHRGTVIAGTGDVGSSLAHVVEVQSAITGHYTSVLRERVSDTPAPSLTSISRGTGTRIFIAYPVVEGNRLWGVIYMSRTPSNIFRKIYAARHRLVAIGTLVVALTILLAWLTSRTLLRPIRELSRQAQLFGERRERRVEPLTSYGTKELATLGESFLTMADTLEKRSTYVRNFATHVSHEFKTPLTAIRGATELLREHHDDMDEAERKRFLDNVLADAARLKALVDRLNELARADNLAPFGETIDLVATLERLASIHADIVTRIDIEQPHPISISEESFGMIADNLVQNARQAGADRIEFSVAPGKTAGVEITISDNGHGISKGNQDKIYEPFFTTRRETNGTGLGLGIVRSLVEAHGGSIEHYPTDRGTTFVLKFAATSQKRP